MEISDALPISLLFLGAAVIFVPLFRVLRLGSVLGYLAAGAIIGPFIRFFITDTEIILHFSEIGVVLFLFLIGLEINIKNLWNMRLQVFGLGSLQMFVCGVLFTLLAWTLVPDWQVALMLGLCLSFSSTAIALQNLEENGELVTTSGRMQLAVVLFQDMAVVPILALAAFLSPTPDLLLDNAVLSIIFKIAALGVLYIGGRYLLDPVFDFIVRTKSKEIFTAIALLIVVGSAALMNFVGLSMALGGFVAGLVLAESKYRHQLESDVEPFKSIILGLFFLAVGMSINWTIFADHYILIIGLCLAYIPLKMIVLFGVGRVGNLQNITALKMAANLSQGGEFAFVVLQTTTENGLISGFLGEMATLLVSLSMVASSLLIFGLERWFLPMVKDDIETERRYDKITAGDSPVLIAGFGRFGQILARLLTSQHIPFTALDKDLQQVDFVREFGSNIYYGDPAHLNLLRAAGAEKADIIAVCVDDMDAAVRIVQQVRRHFPHLKIFVRAHNRRDVYRFLNVGVTVDSIYRELFESSLMMTRDVLETLNYTPGNSREVIRTFRDFDKNVMKDDFQYSTEKAVLIRRARQYEKELQELFARDLRNT